MKKTLCIVLAVLMLGLCACGEIPAETTPAGTTSTPETTAAPETYIFFAETTLPSETTTAVEITLESEPEPEPVPETTVVESTEAPETAEMTATEDTTETAEATPEASETEPEAPEETTCEESTAPETAYATTAITEEETSFELISYDDYLTNIGGISASSEDVEITGCCIEVLTYKGVKYFHAKAVGTATITKGNLTCTVTVEKAKLNIVVVMGQSNSGNHFNNAISDISCPIGTAYWWGNGQGVNATAPTDFTHATKGFHSTLLAELYAQSYGTVKNVLVWHEGGSQDGDGTSKNGSRIYGWAKSATDASGTDYTVRMVNNCVNYYTANADKYEIVSKGAYWLQGEGDGGHAIPTTEYIGCFMAMWNKLKSEAGLQYMAIMRVRHSGGGDYNNDIDHTTVVSAQFTLANENDDIFMATTITENFVGTYDTLISVDISNYITMMEAYSGKASHSDSYGNTATYADGVLTMPMKTLFGSNNNNHYGKFGYTIIAVDAARNMYSALAKLYYSPTASDSVAIIQADISGEADNQTVTPAGEAVTLNLGSIDKDLRFYAAPGSAPGTLTLKVTKDGEDVTGEVLKSGTGITDNTLYLRTLKRMKNAVITVTYTTLDGNEHTVVYNTVY